MKGKYVRHYADAQYGNTRCGRNWSRIGGVVIADDRSRVTCKRCLRNMRKDRQA